MVGTRARVLDRSFWERDHDRISDLSVMISGDLDTAAAAIVDSTESIYLFNKKTEGDFTRWMYLGCFWQVGSSGTKEKIGN